ncbi:hypothetical protein KCP75_17165 [Salmonella enterica subsp. enterica]|nr:hypothetical protein KCP75_17165 [Salmonella enterica subsp. enterica]
MCLQIVQSLTFSLCSPRARTQADIGWRHYMMNFRSFWSWCGSSSSLDVATCDVLMAGMADKVGLLKTPFIY